MKSPGYELRPVNGAFSPIYRALSSSPENSFPGGLLQSQPSAHFIAGVSPFGFLPRT